MTLSKIIFSESRYRELQNESLFYPIGVLDLLERVIRGGILVPKSINTTIESRDHTIAILAEKPRKL